MVTAEEVRFIPHGKWIRRWANLGELKERHHLGQDGTQWLNERREVALVGARPSRSRALSLPNRCGRVNQLGGGCDLWSGWCPRCRGVHYLIQAKLSHHIHRHSGGSDVCDGCLGRIPSPGVVAVVPLLLLLPSLWLGAVACLENVVIARKLL